MPRTLHLGDDLDLPVDVVTRTMVITGQKRMGKSSTAAVIIAEAARAGAVFAILDPTGAWWGLSSNAAGDGPGLDCVVMGGYHGDIPLDPGAGAVVARLVVVDGISVVCDMEKMRPAEQVTFVADFSEAAYHLCQRAVTVVYDEAWKFVPQKGGGSQEAKRCAEAVTEAVTLGGKKGLGTALISQRRAKVNKDVTSQADLVITHRLMDQADLAAIAEWFADDSDQKAAARAAETVAKINRLPKGSVALLAPEFDMVGVYAIRPKDTFDSSPTPDVGAIVLGEPTARSKPDLAALEQKMGAALQAARDDDPAYLRERIKELEDERDDESAGAELSRMESDLLEMRDAAAEALQDETLPINAHGILDAIERLASRGATMGELAAEYEKGWKAGQRDVWGRINSARAILNGAHERLGTAVGEVSDVLHTLMQLSAQDLVEREDSSGPERTPHEAAASREEPARVEAPPPRAPDRTPPPSRRPAEPSEGLSVGAARVLNALAVRHPLRFTRSNVAALARYKASGGAFAGALSDLRRADFLLEVGGEFGVTPAGLAHSGVTVPDPPKASGGSSTSSQSVDRLEHLGAARSAATGSPARSA